MTTGKKPERDLVQLVYVSSAAPDLTSEDLEAIATESQLRHDGAGLTGLLLHQGDHFYGVLEGPERRLFPRMEEIITDPRQRGLRILREQPIDRRRFENWSFGTLPPLAEAAGSTGSPEDFIWALARRL